MSKRLAKEKLLAAILVVYSFFGAALFIFFKKIVPFPLAEAVSVFIAFFKRGQWYAAVPILLLYIATAVAVFIILKKKYSRVIPLLVIPIVVFTLDFAVHLYAFLISDGYEWNYLVSGLLDAAAVFSIIRKGE